MGFLSRLFRRERNEKKKKIISEISDELSAFYEREKTESTGQPAKQESASKPTQQKITKAKKQKQQKKKKSEKKQKVSPPAKISLSKSTIISDSAMKFFKLCSQIKTSEGESAEHLAVEAAKLIMDMSADIDYGIRNDEVNGPEELKIFEAMKKYADVLKKHFEREEMQKIEQLLEMIIKKLEKHNK